MVELPVDLARGVRSGRFSRRILDLGGPRSFLLRGRYPQENLSRTARSLVKVVRKMGWRQFLGGLGVV
jgi:hypothetical protein